MTNILALLHYRECLWGLVSFFVAFSQQMSSIWDKGSKELWQEEIRVLGIMWANSTHSYIKWKLSVAIYDSVCLKLRQLNYSCLVPICWNSQDKAKCLQDNAARCTRWLTAHTTKDSQLFRKKDTKCCKQFSMKQLLKHCPRQIKPLEIIKNCQKLQVHSFSNSPTGQYSSTIAFKKIVYLCGQGAQLSYLWLQKTVWAQYTASLWGQINYNYLLLRFVYWKTAILNSYTA